jgi:hypothetical protein
MVTGDKIQIIPVPDKPNPDPTEVPNPISDPTTIPYVPLIPNQRPSRSPALIPKTLPSLFMFWGNFIETILYPPSFDKMKES